MAGKRTKWGEEVRAAIDAADIDGVPATQILARLHDGSLDGLTKPLPMKDSTFWDILRTVRRQRAEVEARIEPGKERDGANAVLRRCIEISDRELAKVDRELKRRSLTADERKKLVDTFATLSREARENVKAAAQPAGGGKQAPSRGTEVARTAPRSPRISALARARARDETSVSHGNAVDSDGRDAATSANGSEAEQ